MRHMNPPKRPPEIHDEPEPEYTTDRLGDIYRAIGMAIFVGVILLAVGAFLSTLWEKGTREEPLKPGMVRTDEKLK